MSDHILSDAQLLANRENAKKSTGPRTPEGKARSRNNAFKHGLTGATALLPSDNRDAHEVYVDGIVDSLRPGSPLEYEICRDVADAHWRLRRVSSVECKMLTLPAVAPAPPKPERFDPFGSPYRQPVDPATFDNDLDSEGPPPFARREDDLYTAARICLDRPNALTNISLYEQRIQRRIKNSMDELRRLQAERAERTKTEMPRAMLYSKERQMHNFEWNPASDGFVCSIAEIEDAFRLQIREKQVTAAKDSGFNLEKFTKDYPPVAA